MAPQPEDGVQAAVCRLIPPGGLATQPRNSAPDAMGVVWAIVPAPRNSGCIGYSGRSRLRAPLVPVLANHAPAFRLPSFNTSQIMRWLAPGKIAQVWLSTLKIIPIMASPALPAAPRLRTCRMA